MFEEVFGTATICTDNFREGVRDSFGNSIIAETLEPILKQIDSLCHHNEDLQQETMKIDRVLEEARAINIAD
jgi:hypothetical protein